jgi:hypothetical protein
MEVTRLAMIESKTIVTLADVGLLVVSKDANAHGSESLICFLRPT